MMTVVRSRRYNGKVREVLRGLEFDANEGIC